MPETENDETGREETGDDTPQKVEPPENYEYLAFEWVDAHVMELNERCNESIAQGLSMLEIRTACPRKLAGHLPGAGTKRHGELLLYRCRYYH